MPVIPVAAAGGGPIIPYLKKSIRMVRFGCRNRPFYHIVIMDTTKSKGDRCIEQVGSYDPVPNERNERIVAFNYERIRYWMGEGALLSNRTADLLGLAGFLPIHPRSYMHAWRNRGETDAQALNDKWDKQRAEIILKAARIREEKLAKLAERAANQEEEQHA